MSTTALSNSKAKAAKPTTKKGVKPLEPNRVPAKVPEKFTYLLAAYRIELREKGWYVAKATTTSAANGGGEAWSGPFKTAENAVLSIARHLLAELCDRHSRMQEGYGLTPRHKLWGLKPSTRL